MGCVAIRVPVSLVANCWIFGGGCLDTRVCACTTASQLESRYLATHCALPIPSRYSAFRAFLPRRDVLEGIELVSGIETELAREKFRAAFSVIRALPFLGARMPLDVQPTATTITHVAALGFRYRTVHFTHRIPWLVIALL